MNRRGVTLHVSNLLFAGVSAALFFLPGWEPLLYPAYGLIILLNDLRGEEETHVIFLYLILMAGAILMARVEGAGPRAALAGEAAALALYSVTLGAWRGGLARERFRTMSRVEEHDLALRDLERELKYYQAYEESAAAQVRLRRDLTQAAKSLGSTMEAQEVQARLTRVIEGRYPKSRVQLLPGQPDDPLVRWAVDSRMPVLVKDMFKEERFGPRSEKHFFRSALLVGLNVMKRPYGFLRLESDRPEAYNNDDLRTVDLLATVAALTLENIQLYQQVHNLAAHDGLTGLATQRTFLQRLKEEILRAGRSQAPLSLVMCDIDHFKSYNDTYGHQAGDELLRTVSRLLAHHTRPVDCVARYGGEEFALVLPNTVRELAAELANRIRLAVAAEPFLFKGQRTRVTMSFGVSAFPQDATSESQLLRAADERLYRSKSNGRNQVT